MERQWHNNDFQRHTDMGKDFLHSKGIGSHPELPGVMSDSAESGMGMSPTPMSPDNSGPSPMPSLMPKSITQPVPPMHSGAPNPLGHGPKHRRK